MIVNYSNHIGYLSLFNVIFSVLNGQSTGESTHVYLDGPWS